jgi:hypothetical protein
MRKRTIIDIRHDGPHIMPDPGTTLVHHYEPALLAELGRPPELATTPELFHKAGVCAGLGAFFDALLSKGYSPAVANELLWAAYENLKARS